MVSLNRYRAWCGALMLGFCVLITRLGYLCHHRDHFAYFKESTHQRSCALQAFRGTIVDCNGRPLTLSQRMYDVGVDLTRIQAKDRSKLKALASLLKIPFKDLEAAWHPSKQQWKLLKAELPQAQYEQVKQLKIHGVYGCERQRSCYLHTQSLGHLIGYINRDGQAVSGIEKQMQFYLKGQPGYKRYAVNGKDEPMRMDPHPVIDPIQGCTVELTVDDRIQQAVEQILMEAKQELHAHSVHALVTHPCTGEVLAFVNVPFFDSNRYFAYGVDQLTNPSLSNVFEPGSTFKAITVAAALDCGCVRPSDTFNCGLTKVFHRNRELPLPNDWKPFNQIMNVGEILSHSSNRGVAQIGLKLGEQRLYDYSRKFGFGESTCSGFEGETRGILHPVQYWNPLDITRITMGHSIACTILQLHFAIGTIANGGRLLYPTFVRGIYHPDGDIVYTWNPKKRRTVLKASTAETMQDLLLLQPNSNAFIKNYAVAGKTGTSQKIIHGHYSHSEYVASFSGFFPNKNPQFQVTVVIDTPHIAKGTPYGAVTAAPVFKKIAHYLIAYAGLPPSTKMLQTL